MSKTYMERLNREEIHGLDDEPCLDRDSVVAIVKDADAEIMRYRLALLRIFRYALSSMPMSGETKQVAELAENALNFPHKHTNGETE